MSSKKKKPSRESSSSAVLCEDLTSKGQGPFDGTDAQGMACELQHPWSEDDLRAILPLPKVDDHKYSRGVLTVIAGSKRYPGAACLTTYAALKMGAGYTRLVANKSTRLLALQGAPSLVAVPLSGFDPAELAAIKPGAKRAVCLGPGFDSGDKRARKLVAAVLERAECPVLVDGGALAALGSASARKALLARRERGLATVVTPHGGEAASLAKAFGLEDREPQDLCAALSKALGAIVVLKGSDTYLSNGVEVVPMTEGTAALAKAGTGDALAGMISALLAQGVDPLAAAVLGATLHARAGNLAAEELTSLCVTPEDVIAFIPTAVKLLLGGEE